MKVIDIRAARSRSGSEAVKHSQITLLNYGATRSGKTELLATFPRPLLLAEVSEHGWETIENMPAEKFYEPGVEPIVWGIETPQDMMEAISKLPAEVASGRVRTVGVDSLSFYHDLFLNMLMGIAERNAGASKEPDTRKVYSSLASHLRDIRIRLHGLGVHVVWNCQDAPVDEQHKESGPNLAGQSRQKFPAACSLFTYQSKYRVQNAEVFQLHTRQYAHYPAGGRYGELLPPVITSPTFKKLCWYLFEDGRAREAQGERFDDGDPSEIASVPPVAAKPAPAPAPAPRAAPTPAKIPTSTPTAVRR